MPVDNQDEAPVNPIPFPTTVFLLIRSGGRIYIETTKKKEGKEPYIRNNGFKKEGVIKGYNTWR